MARRFVRVDLSRNARDFRPIAVEPGLALLDRIGANSRLLTRWLGRLAAEPEWDDESVEFYVRDDHGGRLEDVVCQPATRSDLEGLLADDLRELRQRLDGVRPDTSTERTIHGILQRTLRELIDDPCRTDVDCHFFRYQDVQDRWRLVWCWGFQRADLEEAPSLLCPDNQCKSLYVRRPGTSGKCPRCAAGLTPREPRDWKKPILLGLLLLLLLAAGGYWALTWRRLVATPWTWTGPSGSRIAFRVLEKGLFQQKDVTDYVAAVTADPRVVRLDRYGAGAAAAAPGETSVQFLWGKLSSTVRLKVQPAKAPKKISVEPASVELGVGTTARLRLIGEYDDGSKVDLTDAAPVDRPERRHGVPVEWPGRRRGRGCDERHSPVSAESRQPPPGRHCHGHRAQAAVPIVGGLDRSAARGRGAGRQSASRRGHRRRKAILGTRLVAVGRARRARPGGAAFGTPGARQQRGTGHP